MTTAASLFTHGSKPHQKRLIGFERLRMTVRLEQAQTARLQELKALIDVGLESADAGRTSVVDDALIAEVKRLVRARSGA